MKSKTVELRSVGTALIERSRRAKRQNRWTESIAVGGRPFIERIKKAMGAMAKGRCLQPREGAFELREVQSVYNAIFDHENRDIAPK